MVTSPPVDADRVTIVCGLVTAAIAVVELLGWAMGWSFLVNLGSDQTATRVIAAVCLVLLGVGLVARGTEHARWASGLGTLVAAVGAVTLAEYVLDVDTGLNTLVSRGVEQSLDPRLDLPSRMTPATAVALLLLGAGLALCRVRPVLGHACAVGATLIGYVSLLGYLYGVQDPQQVTRSAQVALLTSGALLIVGTGVLAAGPGVGLLRHARATGAVGELVRRLSVFALVAPPVIGVIRLVGERSGLYGPALGLSVMTAAWTVGALLATWWAAHIARPIETAVTDALVVSRAAEERLVVAADAATYFASSLELDDVLNGVASRVAETLGDACEIRLLDRAGEWIAPAGARYLDPGRGDVLRAATARHPSRTGETISERVLRTRQPVLVPEFRPEVMASIVDPQIREAVDRGGLRSLIVVPLVCNDTMLGTLSVLRDITEAPYDELDLDLATNIADRGAQAIHLARSVATRTRTEVTLADLARRALTAKDGDLLGQEAVELVVHALSAGHALLIGPRVDGTLVVEAAAAKPGVATPLPRGSLVTSGVPQQVMLGGDSVLCDDMRHDHAKGMVEMGRLLDTDSGLAVVLPGRFDRRGVLAVASPGIGRHTEEDLRFLEAYAGLLATALDRLDAEADLRKVADQRQALLDRLTSAQEDERSRIADGVHDDQVQVMAALGLRLDMLRRKIVESAPELVPGLDQIREATGVATERLRDLMFDLQPPDPDTDLTSAVRETAAYIFQRPARTAWQVSGSEDIRMSRSQLLVVHRIIKEALVNVFKHAGATRVSVTLSQNETGVEVVVSDDGVGMDDDITTGPRGHLGLSSMYDRASVAGGRLRIDSPVGAGTTVVLWLPSEPEGGG